MNPSTDLAPMAAVARGLCLHYGGQPVLNGLDWAARPGQVVGLLGRNGAGKTTLLETLLGLRQPQSGEARLFGQAATALDDAARSRIGYVPQHSTLFGWLTPLQLLAYFKSFYPRWNQAKVDALMARWDIAPHTPIARLSGGQQQRLSIIRALAHEPDLLVLDEPVASLDPLGRRDFLQTLVTEVIERGTTVLFSTHILSDLERVAFEVAFLAAGRIALQAPLDELMDSTRRLVGPAAALQAQARAAGWQVLRETPLADGRARLLVRGEGTAPWPAAQAEAVSFEDLYAELTQ